MARTLLLDGDIFIYQTAAAAEVETEWEDELWTLHSDFSEAKRRLEETVYGLKETLKADRLIMALSDPQANFRKGVYLLYKSNRKKVRKPLVYKPLREFVVETFETFERPTLEGDDVLGILATHPKLVPGEKVIVSIDKDMKTIPSLHYRMNEADLGVFEVTTEEADRWHLMQTLTGDTTDGYPGCPGIGAKRADVILSVAEEEGTPAWDAVVAAFTKAKLSEEEALVQARCARILRYTDYDFKKKQPILWKP